jgi:Outer membrane protein beta-barrel domain
MKHILGLVVALFVGTVVYAQEQPSFEVGLNYSYLRFNPSVNVGGKSFNGGGGDFTWFVTSHIGIKADFEGYGSTTTTYQTSTAVANVQASLFTYNFGPVVKFQVSRFHPFVEALGGAAHSNLYRNVCSQVACGSRAPDNNAGSFIIGGGLDVPIGNHLSLRPVEVDYVLTRFGNQALGVPNQNQNNVRYLAGVRWRF